MAKSARRVQGFSRLRQWLPTMRWGLLIACFGNLQGSLQAQTNNSYPMLMSLRPAAAQVGQTSVHEVNARYNLAGATQILVSGEGVLGEWVIDESAKPEDALKNDVTSSKGKVKFTVAADAIPGVRDFRVMTPHGVSTLGQLVIARDPVVSEAAENDLPEKAQQVVLPATLCGGIEKAEDVDYYRFHAEPNTSLVLHVRSQRLLNRLHDMQTRIDPLISLRNEQGAIIAASDNYFAGDPLLYYRFERAGDYSLEVRDVRYQGNYDWVYSIEAHHRPMVTQVLPNVLQRQSSSKLRLIGLGLPPDAESEFLSNGTAMEQPQWVVPSWQGTMLNEILVWDTGSAVQSELLSSTVPAAASSGVNPSFDLQSIQSIAWPGVVAGRIEFEGEIDRFAFDAKAQERISAQVFARRGDSALDPVIRILNAQGAPLVEIDDGTFQRVNQADCLLENWVVPADGKYVFEIRDLHQRGGASYPYTVILQRAEPFFQLEVDTDKSLLAPGMGTAFFVKAVRKNGFTGEIQLGVEGLPLGVTAIAGRILADGSDGCIVLHATEETPMSVANIQIFGTSNSTGADGEVKLLRAEAKPLQEYYSPGGGRGNYPVDMHTVSVARPMDIRAIKLSTDRVELKPGGSQRIDIQVERAPDYAGNVTLDVIMQHLEQPYGVSLPKGVKVDVASSKTLLTAGDPTGHITLVAAADAPPVEQQVVPVLAHVSINFVMKHTFCSQPIYVTVSK